MGINSKIAVFIYDGFAEFETTLALLLLSELEILTIALEKRHYSSGEKQRFLIDKTIDEVDPRSIDLLIIPGGDSSPLYGHEPLKAFIKSMIESGKTVAGICGGSELLAALGLLEGKRCTGNTSGVFPGDLVFPYYKESFLSDKSVVTDGNIITAQGQAYIEFAATLAKHMGVIKDEPSRLETINWFKNLRGDEATIHWLKPVDGWIDVSESVKVSTSAFEECNMTLIVSEGEALLVDTGYEKPEAERVLNYLEKNHLKLKHIVITHHHEDHDANISLFHMNEGVVYDPKNIDKEGVELNIGNKRVRIFETPGHFPEGDISVCLIDEHILVAGDILYACLPPQLCYGSNPEILIKTLKEIDKANYNWIVPGHGKVVTGKLMLSMAQNYIHKLYAALLSISDSGGTLEEANKLKLEDFIIHRDWMVDEPALDLHRQNIEELFNGIRGKL